MLKFLFPVFTDFVKKKTSKNDFFKKSSWMAIVDLIKLDYKHKNYVIHFKFSEGFVTYFDSPYELSNVQIS